MDVANKMGFPKYEKEDYGQTLGAWGIGPGCYIVLPVLGPSSLRDTAGSFMNVMGEILGTMLQFKVIMSI